MAIEDRNLSIGTKLWAKYKGTIHTAELVETEAGPRYRLATGREFKSPSAAGAAVMGEGRTCNGWAFWTVGDGATATGPVRSVQAARPAASTVLPAPKPSKRTRGRKPAGTSSASESETAGEEPVVSEGGRVECGNYGEVFPTKDEALAHMDAAHGVPEEPPTA